MQLGNGRDIINSNPQFIILFLKVTFSLQIILWRVCSILRFSISLFYAIFFQFSILPKKQRSKDKILVHKSNAYSENNTKNLTNHHANTDINQKLNNWNYIYIIYIFKNSLWIFIYWTNIITNITGSSFKRT